MKNDWREEAIMTQFTEQYEHFYRLAYSYVNNAEDAMDIVQESAYKALTSKKKLKTPDHIRAWCYRIVMNTAIDLFRKKKREQIGVEEFLLEEKGEKDRNYEKVEVMELLSNLNEKDRAVLVLRYFEDMKLEEIAMVTSEKVSTIKSRLYRVLKQLKIQYEEG